MTTIQYINLAIAGLAILIALLTIGFNLWHAFFLIHGTEGKPHGWRYWPWAWRFWRAHRMWPL